MGILIEKINNLFKFNIKNKYISIIGLISNSIGTFISVLSITAGNGMVISPATGFEYHIALISDYGFKIGLYLLIFGFLLQTSEKIYFENKDIKIYQITSIFICTVFFYFLLIKLLNQFLFL